MPSELCSLNLTQEKYQKVMNLMINTVKHTKDVCTKLANEKCVSKKDLCDAVGTGSIHILNKLQEMSSMSELKKIIRKNAMFIEPVEKAFGLKWKNVKVDPKTEIPDYGLTQSTFQYVPILKTLNALFCNDDFRANYIKYNLHEKHKCEKNVYKLLLWFCLSVEKDLL